MQYTAVNGYRVKSNIMKGRIGIRVDKQIKRLWIMAG